jgi:cell wall-associated NlpC family hydrolase
VSRGELQPGDLVFFYTPISHVGLYIGDGMMVHARTYGSPVAVTSVDQRGFRFGVRPGG